MIDFRGGPPVQHATADALAVPVLAGPTLGPGADWVAEGMGADLLDYFDSAEFTGKAEQVCIIPAAGLDRYSSVVFVGLGEECDAEGLRRAAGALGNAVARYEKVATTLHQIGIDGAVDAIVGGLMLGQYRFDEYRSEPTPPATELVMFTEATDDDIDLEAERAVAIADAVRFARDLVNTPAGHKPPAVLAERLVEYTQGSNTRATVYDETQLESERFGGLAAVARGAANPPRMALVEYTPPGAAASLAFVGKGIVFDSGGLTLKTGAGMETMKADMAGAAAVFAALGAISRLGLPVNVVGIAPLTENMPGGSAQHPGDVMRARNGKTIEVLNTDAEGRLILADGLSLAAEGSPDLIVDVATLTGGVQVALGDAVAGIFANDDEAAGVVMAAARRMGEKLWRLPIEEEYRKKVESTVADMKNSADRYGSAITAAIILSEFVGDGPWVHIDIAGTAFTKKAKHYNTKGATGFGVRTLVGLAEDLTD